MNRILAGAIALALSAIPCVAQSLDDLNLQIHGYATQGFLYTTQNNIFTANSSNGSPAWTEAVVNVGARPTPKLRVGVQARYSLLGSVGNEITLDWASADYKVNDKFGVRLGKVKTPSGLFNEIQDIDPSYMFALLPQSVYPILSRNSLLSQFGGVVYGSVNLGENFGKIDYRGFSGDTVMGSNDGYFINQTEAGIKFNNGLSGMSNGGAIHWRTPLSGLMIGASDKRDNQWSASLTDSNSSFAFLSLPTTLPGTETLTPFNVPSYFGKYEKKKLMVAGEYTRLPVSGSVAIEYLPVQAVHIDQRAWYAMATYKLTNKLSVGAYDSQQFDHAAAFGPARYSKDWTVSGRYDFNEFLYAKAEEHFIDGTAVGYDTDMNPATPALPTGLEPTSKLTILKMGVSF